MKKFFVKLFCRLFGHKPMKGYTLEYPVILGPAIGKKYCVRCGKLLDKINL